MSQAFDVEAARQVHRLRRPDQLGREKARESVNRSDASNVARASATAPSNWPSARRRPALSADQFGHSPLPFSLPNWSGQRSRVDCHAASTSNACDTWTPIGVAASSNLWDWKPIQPLFPVRLRITSPLSAATPARPNPRWERDFCRTETGAGSEPRDQNCSQGPETPGYRNECRINRHFIPPVSQCRVGKTGWWAHQGSSLGPMIHFPALRAIAVTGIILLSLTWGLLALRIIAVPKWLRRCQRQIIARNPHLDRRPEGGAGRASAIKSWTAGAGPRRPRDPQGDQDLWQGLHRYPLIT